MNINKIIITGDILRPSDDGSGNNQKINIDWLYHLLKNPLSQSTSLEIEILNWEENGFDGKKFFAFYDRQSMPEDWIALYHSDDVSDEALQYMQIFFRDSLVIGFELPELFINIFNQLNIPFIDIILHPIRYLDDIFFGIRTNNISIFQKVKKFQLDTQMYSIYAGIHHASVSRMPKKIHLDKGSALFAGQTEVDKSLIRGDKVLSLLDFKEEFKEISQRYTKIYYKKHPYAKGNSSVDAFLNTFENVEFLDENFYYLLGQDEIEAVYSISSSTVLEAKYWGKESHYLYKNPFNLLASSQELFDNTAYISIYEKIILPYFWSEILSGVIKTNKMAPINLPSKPNRLRNTLQNYWGYNFLDNDILIRHTDIPQNQLSKSESALSNQMTVEEILQTLHGNIAKKKEEFQQESDQALNTELSIHREMLNSMITTSLLRHPCTKYARYKTLVEYIDQHGHRMHNKSSDKEKEQLLNEYRNQIQSMLSINLKYKPIKKMYAYKKLSKWYTDLNR